MSIGILFLGVSILCAITAILSRDATVPTARKIDTTQRQIKTEFIREIT